MTTDIAGPGGHIHRYRKLNVRPTQDAGLPAPAQEGDSHAPGASPLEPDADEYRGFATDLRWFLAEQDRLPDRLHTRGVWHDSDDGVGSVLGSPALSRDFEAWLERGARSRREETYEAPCHHPGLTAANLAAGALCPECVILDSQGLPMGMSGQVKGTREVYRWPMRAAMAKVHQLRVPRGRPPMSVVAAALSRSGGDPTAVSAVLAGEYPVMGHPWVALHACREALSAVRRRYQIVHIAPYRPGARSEAQLDAEAAAETSDLTP